jgi:hypothetical protein
MQAALLHVEQTLVIEPRKNSEQSIILCSSVALFLSRAFIELPLLNK